MSQTKCVNELLCKANLNVMMSQAQGVFEHCIIVLYLYYLSEGNAGVIM